MRPAQHHFQYPQDSSSQAGDTETLGSRPESAYTNLSRPDSAYTTTQDYDSYYARDGDSTFGGRDTARASATSALSNTNPFQYAVSVVAIRLRLCLIIEGHR